jgi:Cu+-exporting ATPase
VLETIAQVDTVVFDKTGTLTEPAAQAVKFHGKTEGSVTNDLASAEVPLSTAEASWVFSLTRQSTHPFSVRINESLATNRRSQIVQSFAERPGCGIEGIIQGHEICLGSKSWLQARGVALPEKSLPAGSIVYLGIDGRYRGAFLIANKLRAETDKLIARLGNTYELALLSGDNEKERERFRALFGEQASLHFNQSPLDKLAFVRKLQDLGKTVMMVGDGLNDAGALKQSDVGVAVVEKIGAFSPASDVILAAEEVPNLFRVVSLARKAAVIVRISFGISAVYNAVGVGIAAAGILSPIICAILMPLSSFSVVLFACGATNWAARKS